MKKNFRKYLLLIMALFLWLPKEAKAQGENCLNRANGLITKIRININQTSVSFTNVDEVFSQQGNLLVADISILKSNGAIDKETKIPINRNDITVDLGGRYDKGSDGIIVTIRYNYVGDNYNDISTDVPNYLINGNLGGKCDYDAIWQGIHAKSNSLNFRDYGGESAVYQPSGGELNLDELRASTLQYDGNFAILRNRIAREFFGTLDSFNGVTPGANQRNAKQILQCTKEQNDVRKASYLQQKKVASYSYRDDYSGSTGKASLYCMEVIEVTYNRPIALTAGLGFGYDITVRTKAECEVDIEEVPTAPEVCVSKLSCDGVNGSTASAGPNEEFDSCVQACDGGKYTQKCINQCYDQVYGSKNKLLTYQNRYSIVRPIVESSGAGWTFDISSCKDPQTLQSLEYYWDTWYRPKFENVGGNYICMHNTASGDAEIIGVVGCGYKCGWSSCPKGSVSPGKDQEILAERNQKFIDWINNQKQAVENYYNAKKDAADNYSTYDVTITNGTTDKGQQNRTVKLSSQEKYSDNAIYTMRNNGRSELAESTITYQFPQAYREQTSGRVEYKSIASSKLPFKDRLVYGGHNFYTALNSLTTNEEWWSWRTQFDQGNVDASNVPNAKDPDNIDTTLTNLGFLGWDFDVNCFYALSGPGFYNKGLNFVFRPIDLTNVHHGRDPRWNWSESAKKLAGPSNEAELKISKKPYIIDPIALTKDIQKKNYNIYDMGDNTGETPDYTLDLTASTMRKIRSYNASKKQNYLDKDLNCDKRTETGILICKSKFLDDSGFVTRDTAQIGCNNYDPYSKQCAMIME